MEADPVVDPSAEEDAPGGADAPLRRAEARYRSLVENASEMLAIFAADGTTIYESPSNFHTLGWHPGELVGRNALERVHPEDVPRVAAAFERALAEPGATVRVEYRYRHRDGSWRTLSSIGRSLVDDPAVGGIVVSSRDVTEERALEARLRQAQKMDALGRLAAGIAHDFGNLVSALEVHAELLLARPGLDAGAREGLERILDIAGRGADLTRRLLAFGKPSASSPRAVDPGAVVADLVAMLRPLVPPAIEIEVRAAPGVRTVRADPAQLQQVLLNLALNARDAMPDGGTLAIETANAPRGTLGRGDAVLLVVRDTGTGMTQEVQERLFEPFFTTKEEEGGTGLGLAIVYGIVTQAGGSIAIESEPGEGSTFRIALPAA